MRCPMQKSVSVNSSWQSVLASPPRASHILQIYDSDDFLAAAVARFAAAGLQAEEAVLLTGTKDHLGRIEGALRAAGVDAAGAGRNGQLMTSDVHESLVHVVPNGRLEPARFEEVASGALDQALSDTRFTGVRWWGEMTSTLHHAGNPEAGLQAEKLGDAAARQYGATVFCSFLCDKFDAQGYDDVLQNLCCLHSHVIPAEDYVQHRLAVNRAIADVLGDIRGTLLQSLTSWKGLACDLPSSQALLFWVRETLPEHFDAVLERARTYDAQSSQVLA
jgi:hypothetical protein